MPGGSVDAYVRSLDRVLERKVIYLYMSMDYICVYTHPSSSSSLLLSRPELSDTRVYEPQMRALTRSVVDAYVRSLDHFLERRSWKPFELFPLRSEVDSYCQGCGGHTDPCCHTALLGFRIRNSGFNGSGFRVSRKRNYALLRPSRLSNSLAGRQIQTGAGRSSWFGFPLDTLDAVYVHVVPWSEIPIDPYYPHYPSGEVATEALAVGANKTVKDSFWPWLSGHCP